MPRLKTQLLKESDLERASELLRSGELVAFPTDTYFALGAIMRPDAIESLFSAKGRLPNNPVPVLISSADQLALLSEDELDERSKLLADRFWPGALTLVLPAIESVPEKVTAGTGTVGVRVPDHQLARELIAMSGSPLTGTSANLSGQPPCKTADAVVDQLDGVVAAVVDAPCGDETAPSTVVSASDNDLKVLREGSISEASLRAALRAE